MRPGSRRRWVPLRSTSFGPRYRGTVSIEGIEFCCTQVGPTMGGWSVSIEREPWRSQQIEVVLRAVQGFEAAKLVCGAVRCLKTVSPVGEDAGCSTYTYGVVWVVPYARVSPGSWCSFRRDCSGGGVRGMPWRQCVQGAKCTIPS